MRIAYMPLENGVPKRPFRPQAQAADTTVFTGPHSMGEVVEITAFFWNMQIFCLKIWSCQNFVVLLHAFFAERREEANMFNPLTGTRNNS